MADNNPNNLSRLFQTAGTAKPQTGTGYTNLNRLFEANKQNQLGQRVAGDIGTQIGGVQSQLAQQKKQFEEEAEKNKVGGQKDVEQREAVLGRFTAPSSAGGEVSDEDVAAFGRFRSGQYGGPQSLKDTSGLRQTAQQLQGQVSNFSPSGTQELLRRSVGGGKYTQGQSRLDSLLMDRSKLTPVARQAQGLGQEIQRADLAASGQAELNKNLAQQFAKETEAKLLGGLGGIETEVKGQLTAAEAREKQRQDAIRQMEDINRGFSYKRDASGNVQYDEKGQPLKDITMNLSNFEKLSKMEELLRGKTSEEDLKKVFGSGAAQTKKQMQDSLNNLYSAYVRQVGGAYSPGDLLQKWDSAGTKYLNRNIAGTIEGLYGFAKPENEAFQKSATESILAGRLKAGILGDTAYDAYGGKYNIRPDIEGKLGQLPTNLLQSLLQKSALTQNQVQHLTEQGVASEQQRANYEALNKLLGKTPSESKYKKGEEKYQEGKLVFDPTQL